MYQISSLPNQPRDSKTFYCHENRFSAIEQGNDDSSTRSPIVRLFYLEEVEELCTQDAAVSLQEGSFVNSKNRKMRWEELFLSRKN